MRPKLKMRVRASYMVGSYMPNSRKTTIVLLGFLWWMGGIIYLHNAYGFDPQTKEALAYIKDTADDMCQSIPLEHTNEGVTLSGDAAAKVNNLIGKLVNLGIQGSGQYVSEHEKRALLEKDIAIAIQNTDDCKLDVFDKLEEDLLRHPSSTRGSGPVIQHSTNSSQIVGGSDNSVTIGSSPGSSETYPK